MWLWAIAAIVLMFALLSQCSLKKPELIAQIVADCTRNVPFSSAWQQDLQRYGIVGNTDGLPAHYCQCTIGTSMQQLSNQDIDRFRELSPDERLAKLGGEAAFRERNASCLQEWAKQQKTSTVSQ